MKTLNKNYIIHAPIEKVWKALTDKNAIEEWGGGPAVMDDKDGTKFSLWDEDIYGTNTKVEKYKRLEQDWFHSGWDNASKVVFTLREEDGQTHLTLLHKNVPESKARSIEEGWDEYYLEPLKEYAEE